MIDAGIHPGDRVVVEKRVACEKGRLVLKPENKAYPVIRLKEDAEIYGVVVGLVRKY